MAGRLHGKVAVVTGGAQGIGAAIARTMVAEGAHVFIGDILDAEGTGLAAELGATYVHLDVSTEAGWQALREAVETAHQRLDILVNNAARLSREALEDLSFEEWRGVMAVNLDGLFWGAKLLLPLLRRSKEVTPWGASMVNISSMMGIGALPKQSAYGASKAAIRHLSKLLAVEWASAGYDIRVNSIHPGTIRTEMSERAALDWARDNTEEKTLAAGLAGMAQMYPLKRIGRVEDIAMAVVYLASDESSFVTGTELVVDGGYLAM